MGARRKGRELALQVLYQVELSGDDSPRAVSEFWERCDAGGGAREFGAALAQGVLGARERIDAVIANASEHWRFGRLSQVDRNVLRVATYELLYRHDVPASVAIDEAIEIARRYGTDESAAFVNGVLDQVASVVGAKERQGAV